MQNIQFQVFGTTPSSTQTFERVPVLHRLEAYLNIEVLKWEDVSETVKDWNASTGDARHDKVR